MTVTLNLPPEKEAVFKAQAEARGLSLEQWMLDVAEQQVHLVSVAHLQKTDPQEWARHFDAWVDSHKRDVPVLSDEAMSRESIYSDTL
jgi:argininosuccinate lyase